MLVVAFALALSSVASVGETVVHARKAAECTAAIAFRDLVPREQQLGTEAFTMPYLNGGYDAVRYITEISTESEDVSSREVARAQFAQAMKELRGCVVDLYFLVLGNDYAWWVESIEPRDRPRLRLVYDTGGGDADQGERWLALGARAFVAHPGGNVAPVFYAWFLPCWLDDEPHRDADVATCTAKANAKTHAVLHLGAVRAWLGDDEVAALWAGTEAVVLGDPHVHRVPIQRR